jgi:hypothetical protein
MLIAAWLMGLWTRISGMAPLILPGLVRKFNHNWIVSSQKAIKELGYKPMNAREGISNTISWLQKQS